MPTPTEPRKYQVFLRGPVPDQTFGFGSVAAQRSGIQHFPLLVDFPEPSDNSGDEFGIQQGGGFTVGIADEMGDEDWPILDENGDPLISEDGTGQIVQEY